MSAALEVLSSPTSPETLLSELEELSVHEDGDRLICRQTRDELVGVFRGFDPSGRLRLEIDGEERLLASGEVEDA